MRIKKHFYCTKCHATIHNTCNDVNNDESIEIEDSIQNDENCDCSDDNEENYFLEIPPIPQLESLYERPGFYNQLNDKSALQINENYIYDGSSNK